MKHLKLFFFLVAAFIVTPLIAGGDYCECSYSDGDGGHITIGYNCDGSGDAVLQHWEWDNDSEFANSTKVVRNPGFFGPC
jgi:hypothetical protein